MSRSRAGSPGLLTGDEALVRIGTWLWTRAADRFDWCEQLHQIVGSSPEQFDGSRRAHLGVALEADRGALGELLDRVQDDGVTRQLEYRIVRPDGGVRDVVTSVRRVAISGDAPCLIGAVLDMTSLRAAEQRATLLEERFQALIQNSYDLTMLVTRDGIFRDVTPSAERVLGYTAEELVGTVGYDLVHPDEVGMMRSAMAELGERPGGTRELVVRARHKDGSWRWVELTTTNLYDDPAIEGVVANMRDITGRIETEQALRGAERELRELLEHAALGIYRSTRAGKIVSVNPAMVDILGYDSAESLCRAHMQQLYYDPNERARLIERYGPMETFRVETVWKRRDGSPIKVRLTGRLIAPGEVSEESTFEVFVEDVTDQRRLEESLQQKLKMEAIGRLAGGVAHDFNNLLTVILGEVDMALSEGLVDGAGRETLERIRESGQRASALTQQLLSFSRKQMVAPRQLDTNEVVTASSAMLRRLIEEDVELELRLGQGVWPVYGDRSQLEQVLINLAVNARDAMPAGGRLVIETANLDMRSDEARPPGVLPGEWVRIVVSDDGSGMSEDVRQRVFEPFFSTKQQGGTGLGLSTCYSIIQQHSGVIEVDSRPGEGTAVAIYLRRDQSGAPAPAVGASEQPAGGSEVILLVEDEEGVRLVARRMLELLGYDVVAAEDGTQALEMLAERGGRVDLMVSDVILPGLGGRELYDKVTETCPGMKVLFISGYNEDAVLRRGVLEEGLGFLQKPFKQEELGRRVREILDR